MKRWCMFGASMVAVACGGSGTTSVGSDAGTDASGDAAIDQVSGDDSGGSGGGMQTTCSPNIDVTKAAPVTLGPPTDYATECLAHTIAGGLAVVDSAAAFDALFAADAGAACAQVAPPAGTNFGTQRVAVVQADSLPTGLSAYDVGAAIVLRADESKVGMQRGPGVVAAALAASSKTIELMVCVTTCTPSPGNPCPG